MSNTVDTNGWHTVAAVTYEHLNRAILKQNASPKTWSEAAPDGSGSVENGTFGDWALTTDGGGGNVAFLIPLKGGTLTVGDNQFVIPECEAKVTLRLKFLPQPQTEEEKKKAEEAAKSGSTPPKPRPQELRVNATGAKDDLPVTVVGLIPPLPNFMANALLTSLLQKWLTENLQDFNALFATVDLGAEFAHEGLEWLRPSAHGYAVAELEEGATLENSIFGVLCLIDGDTDMTGLAEQVSVGAIPPGADAGLVISPEKFLKHLLMPGMPFMFKGISDQVTSDNFVIDNDGTRIRSIRDLTMLDFEMENGHKVTDGVVPAGQFTMQISETELEISNIGINFEYSPGIDVTINSAGRNTLRLDKERSILTLTSTLQTGSGSVEISKGLDDAMITLEVVAGVTALVGGFGGIVAKSASKAVAAAAEGAVAVAEAGAESEAVVAAETITCMRGLISGTSAKIGQIAVRAAAVAKVSLAIGGVSVLLPIIVRVMKGIADGEYQDVPKINDLTSSAVGKAVAWPEGVPEFELSSAQLNGALQFGFKAVPPTQTEA